MFDLTTGRLMLDLTPGRSSSAPDHCLVPKGDIRKRAVVPVVTVPEVEVGFLRLDPKGWQVPTSRIARYRFAGRASHRALCLLACFSAA
jgi:hypothetical protein